jgi:hypothetical protein
MSDPLFFLILWAAWIYGTFYLTRDKKLSTRFADIGFNALMCGITLLVIFLKMKSAIGVQ